MRNQEVDVEEDPALDIKEGQEVDSDVEEMCPGPIEGPEVEQEPDLVSEDPENPPRRSGRTREAPARYNP